jgi:hypothetical protein
MSTEQKVALVEEAQQAYGLNRASVAVGLPKSSWYYHQKQKVAYQDKYADLLPILEEIARTASPDPEYGVPRIMPELREVYAIDVNHKVIERLLRIWDLVILRSAHPPKPSSVQQAVARAGKYANLVAQMDQIGLFQVAEGVHRFHRAPLRRWSEKSVSHPHHRSCQQDGLRLGRR